MAEEWDRQGTDKSTGNCESWDANHYVPFKCEENDISKAHEETDIKKKCNVKETRNSEHLETALDWIRNPQHGQLHIRSNRWNNGRRGYYGSSHQASYRTNNSSSYDSRNNRGRSHYNSKEYYDDRSNSTDTEKSRPPSDSRKVNGKRLENLHFDQRQPSYPGSINFSNKNKSIGVEHRSNGSKNRSHFSDCERRSNDTSTQQYSHFQRSVVSDERSNHYFSKGGKNNFRGVKNTSSRYPRGYTSECENEGNSSNWSSEPTSSRNKDCKTTEGDEKYRQYPMGFKRLQTLVNGDSEEILLTVIGSRSGFQQILEQEFVKPEIMAMVLKALGKACDSNQSRSVVELFRKVNANKNFFVLVMRFLVSLKDKDCEPHFIDTLSYLTWYMLELQRALPVIGSETVAMLLPLLKNTVEELVQMNQLENLSLLDVIQQLESEKDAIQKNFTGHDLQTCVFEEESRLQSPPNDFRSLPIFPDKKDLEDTQPFLRPIITAGSYSNIDHYLDVQFRLLREDFVRPLRDGISGYKKQCQKSFQHIAGINIYRNVRVLYPRFQLSGIMHNISFDVTPFKGVNWETSKRLLTGSLVCLSSNRFESMLFAEVFSHDRQLLSEGILDIQFFSVDESIMKLRRSDTFVMIETHAYFEAYRYILKKLQSLDKESFPLSSYIVDVEKNVIPPKYLKNIPRVKYDLRPLMIPFPDSSVSQIVMKDEEFLTYDFPSPIGNGKDVEVLNDSTWPPPYELKVDENQYSALNAALTKEFCVIQGPPGTGKTYIGLRFMQIMIHNRNIWRSHVDTPILIVCYTNHALDQFLEGILTFTTSLVRIGGQSESERLKSHNLSHFRKERREKRLLPVSLFNSINDSLEKLRTMKRRLDKVEKTLSSVRHEVKTERDLQPIMETELLESLRTQGGFERKCELVDDGKLILDWLELRLRSHYAPQWLQSNDIVVEENNNNDCGKVGTSFTEGVDNSKKTVENDEGTVVNVDDDLYAISGHRKEESLPENHEVSDDEEALWDSVGWSSKRKAYIKMHLANEEMMDAKQIEEIEDVWQLPLEMRWSLYRSWLVKFAQNKLESIVTLMKDYQEELLRLQELKHVEDLNILKSVCVVGLTTTGAAKYDSLVRDLRPKIVVVEEAAEVLEAHIVSSLSKDTQHLILIGDHQQLRPTTTMFELAEKYNLSLSLFERLVENGFPYNKLITQYRMRTSIRRLLTPHIYPNLKDHPSVKRSGRIRGLTKKVFFIDHSVEDSRDKDTQSFFNVHEASFIVAFCKYLILQDYGPSQITVLSTYSKQTYLIEKMMQKIPVLCEVHVTSVDNYQGNENDIVLVSFVRSNEEGQIGFLKTSNRVCVALSRAKKGLFCIGNFQLLAENSDLWKKIIEHLESKQQIGMALKLVCENHREVVVDARTADDFKKAPEGGCTRVCEHRLEKCGHTCARICHPCDKEHLTYRCKEMCNKILESCTRGHRCQKLCYECTQKGTCGNCIVKVPVELKCKHIVKAPCSSPDSVICNVACQRILNCGHTCTNTCGKVCVVNCEVMVEVTGPCGHKLKVVCHKKNDKHELLKLCTVKCNKELLCKHKCLGNCSSCYQGRFHQHCQQSCNRLLVCGHECASFCSMSCPPCKQNCQNHCAHSRCEKKCGMPCKECNMPCELKCLHQKCINFCGQLCSMEPCTLPCKKRLPCNHKCVGMCGDPCPVLCRICHRKKLTETFFGTESEKNATFVQLEDCEHIFESTGLDKWMQTFKDGAVRMPSCPLCRSVIWKNTRFSNILKLCRENVEKVKEQAFGSLDYLKTRKNELKERFEKMYKTNQGVQIPLLKIHKILNRHKHLDKNIVANLWNALTFLQEINKYLEKFNGMKLFLNNIRLCSGSLLESVEELRSDIFKFIDILLDHEDRYSQQHIQDIESEIRRMSLLYSLSKELHLIAKENLATQALKNVFEESHKVLTNCIQLSNEDILEFVQPGINCLKRHRGAPLLDMTEEEKIQIVDAIGLSQGHWYQCPNGHVYCIDRCGGAMELGQCPECNNEIGGVEHRLVPGNRVAFDMDGAEYSAWSEESNLANFDPIEFA